MYKRNTQKNTEYDGCERKLKSRHAQNCVQSKFITGNKREILHYVYKISVHQILQELKAQHNLKIHRK